MTKDLLEQYTAWIVSWIKYFFKDKSGPAIIGISGGKDSTICAALLARALGPERVIGVQMPDGKQPDISDSDQVFNVTHIKKLSINIGKTYSELKNSFLENKEIIALTPGFTTNTPARLRMTALYGAAALYGGLVCNTCNLSERIIGWETYGGDGFGDFSPIGNLTKSEVVELGDFLGLPKELIHKVPSDGMCGEADEDKFGFSYDVLDSWIRDGLRPKSKDVYNRILELHKKSSFKRENIRIPTCEIRLQVSKDFDL